MSKSLGSTTVSNGSGMFKSRPHDARTSTRWLFTMGQLRPFHGQFSRLCFHSASALNVGSEQAVAGNPLGSQNSFGLSSQRSINLEITQWSRFSLFCH